MEKNKKLNFIAEICQNHQGKFSNVEKMINECAEAGATIVKAQYIFSKNLTYRPVFENGYKKKNIIESIKRPYLNEKKRLRKLDLKKKDYEKFVRICEKASVKPMITCFAREHVGELKDMGFKLVKVASYDCSSFRMIRDLSKKFRKMIISTGATYDNEIKFTSEILKNKFFVLLHCVSIYPTPLNFLNLSRINFLKKFSKYVGYSDHSLSIGNNRNLACKAAIIFGASYLERHVTILDHDKTKDGIVSIRPKDIKEITDFQFLSRKDQILYLFDRYKISLRHLNGKEKRTLTKEEILNRNYYKGRFGSQVSKDGRNFIENWNEVNLND